MFLFSHIYIRNDAKGKILIIIKDFNLKTRYKKYIKNINELTKNTFLFAQK